MSIRSLYPDIRPSLLLDFANARQLDPRITFTRTSTATYVGRNGLIKSAGLNQPRFDHHPTTGESLGLLIEESRFNQIPVSDFSSGWATSNATLVSGISDPEGGTNARKLVTTTTSGTAACFITYNTSITSGNVYTQSVWAKANAFPVSGNAFYVLQMAPSTGFDSRYQNFDLSNGTLGTGDVDSATIEAFPNGWYRCSVTETAISTASGRIAISLQNSPTDTRLQSISTGSANNDGIYVWGAQLEVGSFPTSYIPTSGSAVTRAQDFTKITGTNFTDFYNSTEGTLFAESSIADLTTDNQGTVQLWYSSTDHIGMGYRWGASGSGTYGFYIRNTSDQLYRAPSGVTANTFVKASLAYKSDAPYGASSLNGETAVVDTSINLPTAATEMTIGYGNASPSTYCMKQGHIKSLKYYPKRLPNDQLQTLTK